MAPDTYTSVVATLRGMTGDITGARFTRHVHLDPFEPPAHHVDIAVRVARGAVLLYSPVDTIPEHVAIGRVLKSLVYKEIYCRESERPLFVIMDEAHRFLSSGPEASRACSIGEEHFESACSRLRIWHRYATRSLTTVGGRADAAIDILTASTATKLQFRTTDAGTGERWRMLLPDSPKANLPHVIRARGLATLATGDCYFALSSGAWCRARIELPTSGSPCEVQC
jgi:hypothetical protein